MISSRENVRITMDGTKMMIEVETDPSKVDAQPSASGKTLTLASTGGFRWGTPDPTTGVNLTISKRR